MDRTRAGKWLLTFALDGGVLAAFLADWNATHVFNPLWHAHARYHLRVNLFFFTGVASVATWLLWRPSREPRVALAAAAFLSLAFWTPFFYVPLLARATSYWVAAPGTEPRISGTIVYPNLVIFVIFVLITGAGWRLGRGASPDRNLAHDAEYPSHAR